MKKKKNEKLFGKQKTTNYINILEKEEEDIHNNNHIERKELVDINIKQPSQIITMIIFIFTP